MACRSSGGAGTVGGRAGQVSDAAAFDQVSLDDGGGFAVLVVVERSTLADLTALGAPRMVISRGLVTFDARTAGPVPELSREAAALVAATARWAR